MSVPNGPAQRAVTRRELAALPAACRPRALGSVPRLGLGSRTTTLGWPVIFSFLSKTGIYANAIQNSVARELMPLAMLDSPQSRPNTHLPGLGSLQVGHTGSTIEGLVQWGALAAAEASYAGPGFGADADHLPVYQPGGDRWAETVRFIRCAHDYTHFTLDIGSVVDWNQGPVARLARVPHAIAAALDEVSKERGREAFDLEISLDESPVTIAPAIAATTSDEIAWLLEKLATDGRGVNYIAPHLGFTKGSDVVDCQRLAGALERLCGILNGHTALISIHSGDYLSSATRKVMGKACQGRLLYKVSPALQDLFINAVRRHDRLLADDLGAWAVKHAAERGYACQSPADAVHKCAFAAFGVQDSAGGFELRHRLYGVGEKVRQAFEGDLAAFLRALADDLMIGGQG